MRVSASSTWAAARSPSTTKTRPCGSLTTARCSTTSSCAHSWWRAATGSIRRATPKSSSICTKSSATVRRRAQRPVRIRALGSPAPPAACWCATAPASCRCITRVLPGRRGVRLRGQGDARERPACKAELDPDGLDELMTFWAPLAPRTMFRGVEQLAPGAHAGARGRQCSSSRPLLALGIPGRGRHRDGELGALQDELRSIARGRHADPAARRRAGRRLSIGRTRFLVAGRAAQGARARHPADVLDRLRRRAARRVRAPARRGRVPATRITTTCSARSPTSPAHSRAPCATARARSCAPRPRRCSCCRGWCASRT